MGMVSEDTYHPPAPSQFGAVSAAHLLRRGEFTGMIFCPWKRGQIALQRCEDWCGSCGLADSCASRPSAEDLAERRAAMVELGPSDDTLSKRGGVARKKAPNRYYEKVLRDRIYGMCKSGCGRAAAYRKTAECLTCYARRLYGHKKRELARHG